MQELLKSTAAFNLERSSAHFMLSYDEVYSQPEFYWGRNPNRLCERAALLFPNGQARGKRAIDLGCGEGRDLIYLARQGFEATGVDVSLPGLQKAERWAQDEGLTVRTIQSSLQSLRLEESYDLIYSSGTLTYIPPRLRQETFEHFKRQTRPGGYHVFNAFVEKPYIATAPDWGADEFCFRSGDLLAAYWDWEIVDFSEVVFDCNSSGVPHRHAMQVLITRKVPA